MSSVAQETKVVKNTLPNGQKEVYSVLKSDHEIKHGSYKKLQSKITIESGQFENNEKAGEWETYNLMVVGHPLSSKGSYTNGKRTGVWNFYDFDGVLTQQFDFETNTLIEVQKTEKSLATAIGSGVYKGLRFVDIEPKYAEGQEEFYKFLGMNIKYPESAKSQGISGTVFIRTTVLENGEFENTEVMRGIGGECDQEALRVVKLCSGNFNPAVFNDTLVAWEILVPIRFTLK